MLLKIENDSDDEHEDTDDEGNNVFACSDTVTNALISCEYDE
jgi:hypothetical protein